MSDIDGNDLEINGVPVGKSLHNRQFCVLEWVQNQGYVIERQMIPRDSRVCFFCGSHDLFVKDYCKMCYNDFVKPK